MRTTTSRRARAALLSVSLLLGGAGVVLAASPASAAPAAVTEAKPPGNTAKAAFAKASAAKTTKLAKTKPSSKARKSTRIKRKRGFNGQCEKWVRQQFGASSGFPTAMANWRDAVRKGMAHRGDRTPPAGTLVFWGGVGGKGHVGISVGDGRFRDYRGVHAISSMNHYLGWAHERY